MFSKQVQSGHRCSNCFTDLGNFFKVTLAIITVGKRCDITYMLKSKILYRRYCPAIEKEGHLIFIVSSGCQSGRGKAR